ncbi:MAG: M20 family metallopeptidase [Candidatus Helarchaeota archaeon]
MNSIEILKELIKIKSDNPGNYEEYIALFISNLLRKNEIYHKIIYSADKRANIIGYLYGRNEKDVLIFNGHLDTKPPDDDWTCNPYKPTVKDKKLYGLGATDMKGGIAAIISAIVENSKINLNNTICFIFTADEEMNSTFGMKYLAENDFIHGNFAIVAEPTNLKLSTSSLGNLWLKVTIKGKKAHAGIYWQGVNAIDVSMKIIQNMKEIVESKRYHESKCLSKFPNLNLGMIKGGTHPGSVPEECEFVIDIRFAKREEKNYFEEKLREIVKRATEKWCCNYIIDYFGGGGLLPWDIENFEDNTIYNHLLLIKECYVKITNKPLEKTVFLGGSDAGILTNLLKIPTVIIGPGSLEQAHNPDEWVYIDECIKASKLYSEIIRRW